MGAKVYAFFDRSETTIDGYFTLMIKEPGRSARKLFERLPARSGQSGYTNTNWTRGKSPIPFGIHHLWLKPVDPDKWPDYNGIGEFYPISSNEKNKRKIQGLSNRAKERWDIGLHPENQYPGSAGCIVLLVDTLERKAAVKALFKFLRLLGAKQDTIRITVL